MRIQSLVDSMVRIARRGRRTQEIAAPILLEPTRFPYGPFRFKFNTVKRISHTVLASTDLLNWDVIAADQAKTECEEYLDSDAPKLGHRFYRVLVQGVPSSNVIGYASVTLPPGFCLLANPFKTSKPIGESFKSLPDGTTLSKYDTLLARLTTNSVNHGKWTDPGQQLFPGEGAIFFNPTADYKTHSFVGEVAQGSLTVPLPSGFSLRGSLLPKAGDLAEDLQFPIDDGDVIHTFDRDRQKYVLHPFEGGKWTSGAPVLSFCEGFWVAKAQPGNWNRDLVIPT